jgi:quinol monooxygenase YgiN
MHVTDGNPDRLPGFLTWLLDIKTSTKKKEEQMADKKVTVLARCKAKPGLEEKAKEEIMALVAPTRSEPGCINYDLHQAIEDKSSFMLYENWVSKKDLDEHLEMPYLQAFLGKADEILAEPVEIILWEMISEEAKK